MSLNVDAESNSGESGEIDGSVESFEDLQAEVDLDRLAAQVDGQIADDVLAELVEIVEPIESAATNDADDAIEGLSVSPELAPVKMEEVDCREKFECPVCLLEYLTEDGMISCVNFYGRGDGNTIHHICVDCIRGHAQSALTDSPLATGGIGLPCVYDDCKNVMLMSEFELYLDPDVHSVLIQRMQHESVVAANMSDFVSCPGCSRRFCVDNNTTFYTCECGRNQCRNCHRMYDNAHQNKTCGEMQRQEELAIKEHDIGPRLSEIVVRVCPRCSFQFIKESGCNKITCRCGVLICYLCNAVVAGYEHFCECGASKIGQACVRCHKTCPVHANAEAYDDERIKQARTKAGLVD